MDRILSLLLTLCWFSAGGLAFATEADQAAIAEGCSAKLNWSEQACQCLADKAGELEDVQQAFIAASFTEDSAVLADLSSQMTIPQMAEASLFAVKAGPSCQGGQ